jgi:hypothetical protein
MTSSIVRWSRRQAPCLVGCTSWIGLSPGFLLCRTTTAKKASNRNWHSTSRFQQAVSWTNPSRASSFLWAGVASSSATSFIASLYISKTTGFSLGNSGWGKTIYSGKLLLSIKPLTEECLYGLLLSLKISIKSFERRCQSGILQAFLSRQTWKGAGVKTALQILAHQSSIHKIYILSSDCDN